MEEGSVQTIIQGWPRFAARTYYHVAGSEVIVDDEVIVDRRIDEIVDRPLRMSEAVVVAAFDSCYELARECGA